jgi:hypothetical protein
MEETFIYRSEERHFSEDAEMPGTPAEKLKGSPVVKGSEENRQYCCRGVGIGQHDGPPQCSRTR